MVDGEIVALDSDGLLAFNRLQDFDADNDSMGTQAVQRRRSSTRRAHTSFPERCRRSWNLKSSMPALSTALRNARLACLLKQREKLSKQEEKELPFESVEWKCISTDDPRLKEK